MNAWKAVFTGEESCLWRGKDGEVLKELGGRRLFLEEEVVCREGEREDVWQQRRHIVKKSRDWWRVSKR